MTRTEKLLVENGWKFLEIHTHEFVNPNRVIITTYPPVEVFKCRCGAGMIKRGDFEHITEPNDYR